MKPKEVLSWGAMAITVGTHLLSFLPFIHVRPTSVWPLIFVPMAAFASTLGVVVRGSRREYDARFERLPRGWRLGAWASFAYSMLASFVGLSATGTPEVRGTAFVLTEHGRVLRALPEGEYWRLARAEVAVVFGVIIVFAVRAAVNNALAAQPDAS